MNRNQFEVCLISQIVTALKTGDLAIDGGDRYADQRTQLISWEQYQREVIDYGQLVKLPTDGQAFTAHVQQWLEDQAQKTDTEFPANTAARFERGRLVLRRLTARPIPPTLAALQEVILNRVQPTTILDALADTLAWLGWSRPFGPISGFDDKLTDPSLRYLITVFCYGCQLGPAQTARALRSVDRRQISWINQRHITIESLDKAIEILIKGFEQFALPLLWGSPKRAAADGTKWSMYEQNLLAEQHIRYGGVGGIGYYHVASTCIAIFSNFIACGAWEGAYILDFFEQYAAITQPNTIHADTQGQTAPLFGLAYLMGVTLIPRIRNWQDLTMYRASATSTYVHIDSLFTEVIDWRLIATHLPDMLRIVLSIKTGTLTPSTILRTLNSENQHNLVYRAFRELGRAVRTKTLLQILADVDLRHTMQDASNKNEAFNRFTKWVAFGSAGVITENDREEQRKFVKYNHLVSNCLIVYNTAVLTNILHELAAEGYPLDPEAVAAFSPYLGDTLRRTTTSSTRFVSLPQVAGGVMLPDLLPPESHDLTLHRITLDQVIALWLDAKTKRTRSHETERAYAGRLREFRTLLQAAGLDLDGDPRAVAVLAQGWADQRTKGAQPIANATYNQRLAILSSFYAFARKKGYLQTENPIGLVERRPTQEYASAEPLDPPSVRRHLKAIDRTTLVGKRDYALLGVLLHTGRRLAEVAALHWGNVRVEEEKVTLQFAWTKGGKVMRDTLPLQVGRALLEWLHACYGPQLGDLALDTPLWVSLSNNSRGRALSKQAIGEICEQRVGTSKVHALRHTFARTMEDAGAKVSEIQAKLGHASLATTGKYLAALKRAENRHGEELARLFGFEEE